MRLRAGEQILIPSGLYGLDERQVDDPLVVDFTRAHPERHYAAFGNGPHRCPGSFLAKSEITVFLQEWLARIPDFDIKPGNAPHGLRSRQRHPRTTPRLGHRFPLNPFALPTPTGSGSGTASRKSF